ncbi:DsbA family oxidoreductase [Streptomyces sp. VRA16 Mangrove soil]|uniref:DsbA family oxidoreductase n=1 Tax=Streptomyces sp. VRA16 Mangrove soil TaxID=2817434 RepID=UPI001A9E3A62|nr:DsbA family oxidoreductase [Streptomyces sp. VRA16 Mangrove soil]MBO1332644.1 DsbA family oxidoreductase [Streptomyces sp. VRA16 Mangrove soil]
MNEITVEIWSDVICPWCFIGKRKFEAALADFEHRDSVRVRWRSFELDPTTPKDIDETIAERMLRRQGIPPEHAAQLLAGVTATAAAEGLEYHLDKARPVNTFDAHRVVHLAADRDLAEPFQERLMRAYTAEGASLADRDTLVRLGTESGLDAAEVGKTLDGDDYADAVREDEDRAARLGVSAVPSFVFAETYVTSGAQPVETLTDLLRRSTVPR